MWFRNIRPFRLPSRLNIDADTLEQRLSSKPFVPCRPAQPLSLGWLPALADQASALTHAAGPFWLVRMNREEKLLPASVVRDEANSRIEQIQAGQGRKVSRKERLALTDEVTQDLLPRAFTRGQAIDAIIHDREGWLWVNTASAARAEELLGGLREALGSLPVTLPDTQRSPALVMSDWLLHGELPDGFELGMEADLADPREDGGVVRARSMELDCDEIRAHVESGKQVTRLALRWQDRLDFILDSELVMRRLKFTDALVSFHEEMEDPLARKDADFLMMSEALFELQLALVAAFGGLAE